MGGTRRTEAGLKKGRELDGQWMGNVMALLLFALLSVHFGL
jgi:hypothetical protein